MSSTDAGTPAAGDGHPPGEPPARRDLRDGPLGKIVLLGLVLVAALLVARTCGSADRNISADEAIEIAIENASFEPCPETRCRQARFIQRGIPVRAFWGVVLAKRLDERGQPAGTESFLVSASTGEVSRP